MLEERLRELLNEVRRRAGPDFSGIGVVVASETATLPIVSLRPNAPAFIGRPVVDVLAAISVRSSDLHDGFHVLSPILGLELVAQYFAPPVRSVSYPLRPSVGGARYMTALLGSMLPGVIATGLATVEQASTVFRDGVVVAAHR